MTGPATSRDEWKHQQDLKAERVLTSRWGGTHGIGVVDDIWLACPLPGTPGAVLSARSAGELHRMLRQARVRGAHARPPRKAHASEETRWAAGMFFVIVLAALACGVFLALILRSVT